MEREELFRQLVKLAERFGYEVRLEPMETAGGACRLGGKSIIFVNELVDVADKLDVMKAALAGADISDMYLLPEVREFLESWNQDDHNA